MRNCLKCSVKLSLKSVTCPGTIHIQNRNPVYLSVCLFGQLVKTKSVLATFPLRFNERYKFEKVFTVAQTLESVQEILEDEVVTIELCQYSDVSEGGNVIASFSQAAKSFLYPKQSLTAKDGFKRGVLLARLPPFSFSGGLDPKLVFSTQTVILETDLVEHYVEDRKISRKSKSPPARMAWKTKKNKSPKTDQNLQSSGNLRSRFSRTGEHVNQAMFSDKPPFKCGIAPLRTSVYTSPPKSAKKSNRKELNGVVWDSPGVLKLSRTPPVILVFSSSEEDNDSDNHEILEEEEEYISRRSIRATPQKPSEHSPIGRPQRSVIAPIRRDLMTPLDVKRRVKHLLEKNKSFLEYDVSEDNDSDSLDSVDVVTPTTRMATVKRTTNQYPPFSPTQGLGSSRSALDDRYSEIYKRMYEEGVASGETL